MFITKIFIPSNYFCLKEPVKLYGKFIKHENSSCSFFIVDGLKILHFVGYGLQQVGEIKRFNIKDVNKCKANTKDSFVTFMFDDYIDNILIHHVNISSLPFNQKNTGDDSIHCPLKIELILYDGQNFEYLSKNEDILQLTEPDPMNDITHLAYVIRQRNDIILKRRKNKILSQLRNLFTYLIGWIIRLAVVLIKPFQFIFKNKAVSLHFNEWKSCLELYSFQNGKAWTIVFDVIAGLMILFWLLHLGNPGQYLMTFTEFIVHHLRHLLENLRGNPVGLKLNVQLNHFLLNCFMYHVDLWATFLKIVSPAINYLFIPLAVVGFCGLSFQLALLSDLLVLITLHAHCFYIYAAVLYRVEIVGIQALWRVVLGRRKNVLKGRVESHDYMNQQLYLATLFFASLLFILPTVLVYYVVFASLRFGTYCITSILLLLRRKILYLPIYTMSRWFFRCHVGTDNIELEFIEATKIQTTNCSDSIIILFIKPKLISPWSDYRDKSIEKEIVNKSHQLTIGQFFIALIKGHMMGIIYPENIGKINEESNE